MTSARPPTSGALSIALVSGLAWAMSACAAGTAPSGASACDPNDRFCVEDQTGGGRGGGAPDRDAGTDAGADTSGPVRDVGGGGGDNGGGVILDACDNRTCEELDAAGLSRPDTDGDGIPDCIETSADLDGDGLANCVDDDSDGDGLPDAYEGQIDTDGDGIPDFLDTDSDNDNILDSFERDGDPDEDGIPNFRDLDSDGDGWPDAAEYGRDPGTGGPPIDHNGDGEPDYLDLDSDGDGLADAAERGCPASTNRTMWDTDGDGYNDLVEIAFGSNACDPADDISDLVDFYFELPYRGPEETDTLEFSTDVRFGDVVFNMDTTGSMGGEIDALKSSLSGVIIPALGDRLASPAYAVTRFDDFPCGSYGDSGDVPFELLQRATQSRGDAQSAVNRLTRHRGGDYYESGFESLYQIASGAGRSECGFWPAFDAAAGYVEGVADGWIGGVGFREGALPIVVHITDAPSHVRGEGGYGYGATRDDAYAALGAIGARVIGVASGDDARADTEQMAVRTGAVVPGCAWDTSRPSGCSPGQCCTGASGRGRGTDSDGNCPLVFDINADGAGLDTSIVSGIDALINFAPIDVSIRTRPDPEELSVDTTCFLKGVIPESAVPRPGSCTTEPVPADFDGDGVLDGFRDVTPGTQLFFEVIAENDTCVPPLDEPQVFIAYIDVLGDGTAVLDTQLVTILVPPDIKR